MTEQARTGIGGKLEVGDGATPTEAFTEIAEIVSIDGPSLTLEEVDATTIDGGGVKQSVGGLKDYGKMSVELLYTKHSTHTQLRADAEAHTERNYKITFPTATATVGSFSGYVLTWSQSLSPTDPMRATVEIKINSDITWT